LVASSATRVRRAVIGHVRQEHVEEPGDGLDAMTIIW
jgi:hypothetical protein